MSMTADVLAVLTRADRRYADRRDLPPAETVYLEYLTCAMVAHITRRYRSEVLTHLVAAVLVDDFDPDGDLVEQATEAVRIVGQVRVYLERLRSRSRGAA